MFADPSAAHRGGCAVHPAGPGNTSPHLPAESCGRGLQLARCQKTLATAQTNGFLQAYRMTVQASRGPPKGASDVLSDSVCHAHRQDALSRTTAGMLE